jgi:ElaB/YqjD/DUF883 family membrane-anchored ribosome-binding protein
MASHKRGHRH